MVLSERAAGLRGSKLNPSSLLFYRHSVHAVVFNLLNRHSLVRNFIVYWAPASCGGLLSVHPVRDYKNIKKTHRTILLSNKRRKPNVEKNKTPTMKTIFLKKNYKKRIPLCYFLCKNNSVVLREFLRCRSGRSLSFH